LAAKRDYYETLGVSRGASADEIKSSYRRLARQHHPDVNPGDDGAEARFKAINEAYEVLSDPSKRRNYDQFGHAGVEPGGGSGADFGFAGGMGGFGDIFDMFFGSGGREYGRAASGAERGSDLRYDLEITLEEAAFGAEKTVPIARLETCGRCSGTGQKEGTTPETCGTCRGSGQVRATQNTFLGTFSTVTSCQRCGGAGRIVHDPCTGCNGSGRERKTRKFPIKIPAGVEHGARIRFSGEGEGGIRGGGSGDLYVVVHLQPHPVFERHGRDIACEVGVSFAKAALGGKIEVPTLDGKEILHIPEGTQPGDVFRLRGKGMPEIGRHVRGDQHVIIQVSTPTPLNDRQRRALMEFAAASGEEVGDHEEPSVLEKIKNIFAGKGAG
jgi:molecular chaperone DnaJ